MSERLSEAIKNVCWKATPYGENEAGDIRAYLVPAGAIHRLVGAAQGEGISASLRNWPHDWPTTTAPTPGEPTCPTCGSKDRLVFMEPCNGEYKWDPWHAAPTPGEPRLDEGAGGDPPHTHDENGEPTDCMACFLDATTATPTPGEDEP